MMSTETTDIIDLLAGIEPGSSLTGIRARRLSWRRGGRIYRLALSDQRCDAMNEANIPFTR